MIRLGRSIASNQTSSICIEISIANMVYVFIIRATRYFLINKLIHVSVVNREIHCYTHPAILRNFYTIFYQWLHFHDSDIIHQTITQTLPKMRPNPSIKKINIANEPDIPSSLKTSSKPTSVFLLQERNYQ